MSIENAARRIHDEWINHSIPVPSVEYLARIIQKEMNGSEGDLRVVPAEKDPGTDVQCPECDGRGVIEVQVRNDLI